MTVYFTHDVHEDGIIEEGANIMKFDSLAELNEYLNDSYRYGEGLKLTGIQKGSYSDCWLKCISILDTIDSHILEPFDTEDVYVQHPDEHPGGREYWVTPTVDVYVPVIENVEEDDED